MSARRRVLALCFGVLQLLIGSRAFFVPAPMGADASVAVAAVAVTHVHGGHDESHTTPESQHRHQDAGGCHAGLVCCIPIVPLTPVSPECQSVTVLAIAKAELSVSVSLPISARQFRLPPATPPPAAFA